MGWNDHATEVELNLHTERHHLVCSACIGDRGIQNYIRSHAVGGDCDFCGDRPRRSSVARLVDVVQYMADCLKREHADALDELGIIDGEFIGAPYDTDDLLCEMLGIEFPRAGGDELRRLINVGLGTPTWCPPDPYGPDSDDVYKVSWQRFSTNVQRGPRFLFSDETGHDEDWLPGDPWVLTPTTLFEAIAHDCSRAGLVKTWRAGKRFYRARRHGQGQPFSDPRDVGPPSHEHATQSNRMNPPGVPALYAAMDARTALLETFSKGGGYTIGRFELTRDVQVLDLSKLPRKPGLFDEHRAHLRSAWPFIEGFAADICKPVSRDDRHHVEYVPTQVAAEYFRYRARHRDEPIKGIVYASTRDGGGTNVVLFATPDDVAYGPGPAQPQHWLRPVGRLEARFVRRRDAI